jgi:ketosteroid isomerase-like protein
LTLPGVIQICILVFNIIFPQPENLKPPAMRKSLIITLTVLTCLGLLSCNSGASEKSSIEKTETATLDKQWAKSLIDSMNTKFAEGLAAGDSSALASLYWPNAELLLDNSEPVKGSNIVNAWGSAMRMGIKEIAFTTTDITGSSTFIIETGNYVMKDGVQKILDQGKYVVVWEQRNNEWKIYRDIGCTSLPLAPAK